VSDATAESHPPDRLPPRGLRAPGFLPNLGRRVATALVALPLLVATLLLGPAWLVVAVVGTALAVGQLEFFSLLRARGMRPMPLTGFLLAAAVFLHVLAPGWLPFPVAPLGALLLLGGTLWRGSDRESVSAAAATLLGALYLGALGGTIAALRVVAPLEEGGWRLLLLLAILVLADSFAFFVGHAVGRRPLAPAVSPGKTVEGALGGLLGGLLGALAVRQLGGLPGLPALDAAGLGVAVAAMGIVGDLDESLLKRWAGVKDSGTLFPGHGGMLDRLDSLLFGAPVLYYYFQYVH
jgi:phosphatidate cytidylyltransferase